MVKYFFKIPNMYDIQRTRADIQNTEGLFPPIDETELIENFDEQGNNLMTQQGATFIINGEEQTYADIWHKKLDE